MQDRINPGAPIRTITAQQIMRWRERGMAPIRPQAGVVEYDPPVLGAVAQRWLAAAEKLDEADRDLNRICREHGWVPATTDDEGGG